MLTLLGCVLMISAGTGTGWVLAAAVAGRPRELAELQAGLALLETEVAYGAVPLPAALRRAAAAGGLAGRVFGPAAGRVDAGELPADALGAAIRAAEPESALHPGDWDPLFGLAAVLGASDRADQVRHLRLCRERLVAAERAAEAQRRRTEHMYRQLGLLAGLAAALVLA